MSAVTGTGHLPAAVGMLAGNVAAHRLNANGAGGSLLPIY